MSSNPVVSLTDVSYLWGNSRGLEGISLDLYPGITALMGRNGSGKTTLFQVIAGFLPARGCIAVNEVPIDRAGARTLRKHISFLPAWDVFDEHLTLAENGELFSALSPGTWDLEAYRENLRELSLGTLMEEEFGGLSTGERRKAQAALVLASRNEIILMDEPVIGVDTYSMYKLHGLLARFEAKTVLLSAHTPEIVNGICSRLLILDGGRLVCDEAWAGHGSIYDEYLTRFGLVP